MAKHTLVFQPMNRTVQYDPDNAPLTIRGMPGSIMDSAAANHIPIEHACGGIGACATCHVIIDEGMENLTEADDDELDRVEQAPGSTLNSRLACKAVVQGDVTVRIPEWNRNLVSEEDH